jgi:amidase
VGELDAKETLELKEGQVAPPCKNLTLNKLSKLGCSNVVTVTGNYEQLKGAPCSIQVFTTTLRDEECLEMAKQIDQCLKGNIS